MARMIETLSMAPASILDIEGGTLSPGSAADFILFRPNSGWIITGANFISDSRITPLSHIQFRGLLMQPMSMASLYSYAIDVF